MSELMAWGPGQPELVSGIPVHSGAGVAAGFR